MSDDVTLKELRKVAKHLLSGGFPDPIRLNKEQAESLNNNISEGQELYKEGDLYRPGFIHCHEDFIHDMKNLEAQIIADRITESYIKKYPFGGLK